LEESDFEWVPQLAILLILAMKGLNLFKPYYSISYTMKAIKLIFTNIGVLLLLIYIINLGLVATW